MNLPILPNQQGENNEFLNTIITLSMSYQNLYINETTKLLQETCLSSRTGRDKLNLII